jgi:hypothetical protein
MVLHILIVYLLLYSIIQKAMKKCFALLISLLLCSNTLLAQVTTTGTTEPSINLALQGIKDLKS